MERQVKISSTVFMVLVIISALTIGVLSVFAAPAAQSNSPCAGFTTRLRVGITARVTPGDPNNVRAQPSTTATQRGQIPGGASFSVIGGPRCAGGYTWWQVRYGSIEGWTAEASTGGTYWLEPISGSGGGTGGGTGGGGGTGSGGSLPADTAAGIGFNPGGGGGGPTGICYTVGGNTPEDRFQLETTIAAFDGQSESFTSYGNGTSLTFRYPRLEINIFDAQGICTNYYIDPASVSLYEPDGSISSLAPIIYYFEDVVGSQIGLPLEAYRQFGTWTLQISDFYLYIEVTRPSTPHLLFVVDSVTYNSGLFSDARLLTGVSPRTEVAIVVTPFEGSSNRVIYYTTDANGTAIVDVPSDYGLSAVVPADNRGTSFLTGLDINGYTPPERYEAQVLFDAVWNQVDARTWTCPGALPIRFRESTDYFLVMWPELYIYAEPTFSSSPLRTVYPGDELRVSFLRVECADGYTWWQVDFDDTTGWVTESGDGEYYLEPL